LSNGETFLVTSSFAMRVALPDVPGPNTLLLVL
jgi:hypothetical protein